MFLLLAFVESPDTKSNVKENANAKVKATMKMGMRRMKKATMCQREMKLHQMA